MEEDYNSKSGTEWLDMGWISRYLHYKYSCQKFPGGNKGYHSDNKDIRFTGFVVVTPLAGFDSKRLLRRTC